jgi:hypothetical protein
MTSDDDFIGTLEDYLDSFDGATPLPERVRDAIHAELPGTRQVRPVTGPMKVLTTMSETTPLARWALVAAAIVVAVALGAAYLNVNRSISGVGAAPATKGPPAPSPGASTAPVRTPAPVSLRAAPTAACDPTDNAKSCLAAGHYSLPGDEWPATISFELPAGWFEYGPGTGADGVLVDGGPEARNGSGWGIQFLLVGDVSRDPCDASAGSFPPSDVDTPDKLAAAMATWPDFHVSRAVPTTVGGLPGRLVEVTSTGTAACRSDQIWKTPSGTGVDTYPMTRDQPGTSDAGQFRILDVGGKLLVIRTDDFAGPSPFERSQGITGPANRHAADQAELHAILDSIQITDAKLGF